MKRFSKKGFTLIELIVVAAILGAIVVIALVALNPLEQINKSNDTRRKSDLAQIQRALEAYYQDNNAYPCNSSTGTYRIVATAPRPSDCSNVGEGLNPVTHPSWAPYMNALPADPNSSKRYKYFSPDGQHYYLYASLDRADKDPSACNGDGTECQSIADNGLDLKCASYPYSDGQPVCNYGVSSPNTSP